MKIIAYNAYTDQYKIRYDNGFEMWVSADEVGEL